MRWWLLAAVLVCGTARAEDPAAASSDVVSPEGGWHATFLRSRTTSWIGVWAPAAALGVGNVDRRGTRGVALVGQF